MQSSARRRQTAVAAMVLIPALAACSGEADDSSGTPVPAWTESPLTPYLPLYATSVEDQRLLNLEADTLIAECMKAQGFDYDQPYVSAGDIPSRAGLTATQWAEQYGYGLATLDLAAEWSDSPSAPRSAAEQESYDAALYGEAGDPTDDVRYDWTREGCLGSAYHQVTGGADEVLRDPGHNALFEEIDTVQSQVASSPAMAALDAEWSTCMVDAGHADLPTPTDAEALAQTRLGELVAGLSKTSTFDIDLAALRAEEVALAVADATCQAQVSYVSRSTQLLWAAEADLVDRWRSELEALATDAE